MIDTHIPFKPEDLPWPDLDASTVAKLASFPIWDYAVHTERQVYNKLNAFARTESDPLLREALDLMAFEEKRHSDLLKFFVHRYGLPFAEKRDDPLPLDLEWGFMRTGAGECIDSFFAFGFYALSKSSGDYARELLAIMEPIVQEEARHILFYANWSDYQVSRKPWYLQGYYSFLKLWAYVCAGTSRLLSIRDFGGSSFTINAREHEKSSLSAKSFIKLCLSENRRRLSVYDPTLKRPMLIPRIVRMGYFFL